MKRNNSLPALTVLALLCLLALAACGDIPMKETIVDAAIDYTWVPVSPSPYFKAPTPTAGTGSVYSVDISDSFAVVGAPYNNSNQGAVHVYANDGAPGPTRTRSRRPTARPGIISGGRWRPREIISSSARGAIIRIRVGPTCFISTAPIG